jgi:hypothetical protein
MFGCGKDSPSECKHWEVPILFFPFLSAQWKKIEPFQLWLVAGFIAHGGFNSYSMQCIYLCFVLPNPNHFPSQLSHLACRGYRFTGVQILSTWLNCLHSAAFFFLYTYFILDCPRYYVNLCLRYSEGDFSIIQKEIFLSFYLSRLCLSCFESEIYTCFLLQVAASMQKDVDGHVPSYPNLPSKLICLLHNVTLHVICSYASFYCLLLDHLC